MPESTFSTVYKFTWHGELLGQEVINTFYYGANTPTGDFTTFINAQVDKVWNKVYLHTSNQYMLKQVTCEGVKGVNNFGSNAFSAVGSITGDCLPPFVCWDFTLVRAGVKERNGYKRFAGVPESSQVNGSPAAGYVSILADTATALFAVVNDGDTDFTPLICRSRVGKIPQNPHKYYTIGGTQFSKIGSQNSRKVGHGR